MRLLSRLSPYLSRIAPLAVVAVVAALPLGAQRAPSPDVLRARIHGWRLSHDVALLGELRDFLAIPNLATDTVHIRQNARTIAAMLERRGVKAQLLESPGSPPAVLGELRVPGATRTVMLYAHYDGQPVDTSRWATPPWTPVLRDGPLDAGGREIPWPTTPGSVQGEWRLYARSASDDKSPIVVMLAALDALRDAGVRPAVNVKFFFEGEEEAGSPHAREMLTRHKDLLGADLWLFCDGPVHQTRRLQIVYGVRGDMSLGLTVYGPARALHSGHYGNWAPNPTLRLAELLTSMRDADGNIRIAGFLDDVTPISAAERAAIARAPQNDSALRAELLLAHTEAHDAPLLERIMLPAINVRGFQAGLTGAGASNTIQSDARASIDFRLVPKQTPERVRELVEAHARSQGWYVVHDAPTPAERLSHDKVVRMEWEPGYPAVRTAMDSPAARALSRAAAAAMGGPLIEIPTSGGSLPMHDFEEATGAPLIILPIVNHDNNQHASDENVRLQNLWDGIELYAGVLAGLRW